MEALGGPWHTKFRAREQPNELGTWKQVYIQKQHKEKQKKCRSQVKLKRNLDSLFGILIWNRLRCQETW
jgi:hypothetical protein